ncbi:MAG: ACT domain-containing protein [Clostridiales bacterium]|nr:ACT domain-containing protein [Clostridiales bacterium]
MSTEKDKNKAVITVVGCDAVGIIAKISALLAEEGVNINDITQTILDDIFTMIMLVDLKAAKSDMKALSEKLDKVGEEIGVSIRIQHTDLFYAMHRI